MPRLDGRAADSITKLLARQADQDCLRVTAHAHREMVAENIALADVICALRSAYLVENYPDHQRGPCCLVCGRDAFGRYLHVVCTTALDPAIIITVYEPRSPKWVDPFTRRKRR